MLNNEIVKTSDERVLYFFIKDGLCVKDLMNPTEKYNVIFEDAVEDFYAVDFDNGKIGIVCQDKSGSIIFLKENEGTYLKTTLLNNRNKTAYDKNFKIHKNGNWISISYIIEYQNSFILSFQIVNDEEIAPIAVEYVKDKNYYSFVMNNYDIFFLFNKEDGFYYKIYKWGQKKFFDSEKLGDGKLVSCGFDKENFYLIYNKDKKYKLKIIKNEDFDFTFYDYDIDFVKDDDEINIVVEKDSFWITVKRNGFLFGRKANIDFNGFSDTYNFMNEGEIINCKLEINENDYEVNNCFAYLNKLRPKLIIYKDLLNTFKTIKKPLVSTSDDEFTEFTKIENKEPSDIEKKLTKLEIRINSLEEKMKKYAIGMNNNEEKN